MVFIYAPGCLIFLLLYFASEVLADEVSIVPASPLRLKLLQTRGVATTSQVMRRLSAMRESLVNSTHSQILPLFQGMGVHYAYMWVGTPPQRVTVIVDTGSHHTAFPCVGCKCGKHVSLVLISILNNMNLLKTYMDFHKFRWIPILTLRNRPHHRF
jgi:hypothetical protein